jgi:alanine racemase
MLNEVTAKISISALQHNFQRVRTLKPSTKIIAMIKSNAYGHGLIPVAQALTKTDAFGVARLAEALQLRAAGITQDILLMPGFLNAEQLPIIAVNNLQIVVHDQYQIDLLSNTQLPHPLNVWLKVDTGMNRLGFKVNQAPAAYARLCELKNVGDIRMMTHFACVDEKDHPTNQIQFDRLREAEKLLPGEWSSEKSAAIMCYPDIHDQWVRPGIMLYGVSPFANTVGADFDLLPVMELSAPVLAVHKVSKGEGIGYGSTWHCPEDMLVGTIGIGYGDGYPRRMENGTPVIINGKPAPRVGRVCMDMIMVDLRGHNNVKAGDTAILWGVALPVETIAPRAGTSAYELLCAVTKRVKFEYI